MFFGKLDRYIIKKFLGTFFFIIGLIMMISVVFDFTEKMEDFIDRDAPIYAIIFDYYLNFVLYYGNLFSSLIIFIAVILFTSKLAQQSEIISILAGGISFKRLMLPYFTAATFLVVLALILNHFIIPSANKNRLDFEEEYIRVAFRIHDKNLHREIEPGTIVYIESFNTELNLAYKFSIEKWVQDTLVYKLRSDRANYIPEDSIWRIRNFYERIRLRNGVDSIHKSFQKDTTLNLEPKDFGERVTVASTLQTPDLNLFIEKEKMKGNDKVVHYEIEKHQRTSYPIATYILSLIGVSVASRKVRGGTGMHIALGLLLAVIYIFAFKITTVAAVNAGLNTLLAVWIPNFIFTGIAIYLYWKAPK